MSELTTQKDNYDLVLLRKIFNVDDEVPEEQIRIAEQYCIAKNLDPIKKPIAIIPFTKKWKDSKNVWHEKKDYQIIPTADCVKVVASRANWAGNDDYIYGPIKTFSWNDPYKNNKIEVEAPEWGQITVYKIVGGVRCAFMGPRVYFAERNAKNSNWAKQPMAMFNKCILVAALRNACPEECSGMYIKEELEGDFNYEVKESKSAVPSIEQAKNEPPMTEEEEADMRKELEKLKEPKTKEMTETEAKARKRMIDKKEPEIIEATAKEVKTSKEPEPTSSEIADNLVKLINSALESDDVAVVDFVVGEIGYYKTMKLANKNYVTSEDHNRIATAFLDFKAKKGIE